MNKRIKNKKFKQRYNYILNFLVNYTEVSRENVVKDCHDDIEFVTKNCNMQDTRMFIDCRSIDLMIKYQCGWWMDR